MTGADPERRHVVIRGRVQGVGFRYWTQGEALRLGLEGFVRNRRDGTVEAMFSGPTAAVEAMLAACRQGPPGARVTAVEPAPEVGDKMPAPNKGERFSMLSTV
ncbi:MAG: acylphosphatase [Variibacter sp.]